MRYFASLIAVCGFLLASSAAQKDPAKKDLDSLQGSWQAVSVVESGRAIKGGELKVIFKANKMFIEEGPKKGEEGASFKLYPSKKPKALDVTPPDGKTPLIEGIYAMEGGKLKICLGRPGAGNRPTEFKAPKDSGAVLYELVRKRNESGRSMLFH